MLLGDVEKLLCDGLEIDERNRATFKSRIQHLQRMQFPPGTNTGKGKKFDYGWPQIIQYVVAFDLIDQGVSPEIATSLVGENKSAIESGAVVFARTLASSEDSREMLLSKKITEGYGVYLRCVVNGLGSLKRDNSDSLNYIETLKESVLKMEGDVTPDFLFRRNATFLNFGCRVLHAIHFVGVNLEQGIDEAMYSFIAWADSHSEDTTERS